MHNSCTVQRGVLPQTVASGLAHPYAASQSQRFSSPIRPPALQATLQQQTYHYITCIRLLLSHQRLSRLCPTPYVSGSACTVFLLWSISGHAGHPIGVDALAMLLGKMPLGPAISFGPAHSRESQLQLAHRLAK